MGGYAQHEGPLRSAYESDVREVMQKMYARSAPLYCGPCRALDKSSTAAFAQGPPPIIHHPHPILTPFSVAASTYARAPPMQVMLFGTQRSGMALCVLTNLSITPKINRMMCARRPLIKLLLFVADPPAYVLMGTLRAYVRAVMDFPSRCECCLESKNPHRGCMMGTPRTCLPAVMVLPPLCE